MTFIILIFELRPTLTPDCRQAGLKPLKGNPTRDGLPLQGPGVRWVRPTKQPLNPGLRKPKIAL